MAFLSSFLPNNGNKKADNTLGYMVSKPDEEYDFSGPESKFAEEYTPEEIAANKQERFNNTVKWCVGALCFATAAYGKYLDDLSKGGGKSKRNKGKDKRRKKTRKRTLRKKQKTVI